MKSGKQFIITALLTLALLSAAALPALAADSSMSFDFRLTSDGSSERYVQPGDVITVSFTLARTDSSEAFTLYTMQNEISYDDEFFELVEGSTMTKSGVATTEIGLLDGYRSFYMNRVSMGGGEPWEAETLVGNFQLRVIGRQGTSIIENRNCIVGNQTGTASYLTQAKNLTVILSSDCIVHFETYDGTDVPDQTVRLGEKVTRPEDPTLDGYRLENWYKDWYETQVWDFDSDVVDGNMTLFAKWVPYTPGEAEETPAPDGSGGAEGQPDGGADKAGLPKWAIPLGVGILAVLAILFAVLAGRVEVTFAEADGAVIGKTRVRKGTKVGQPSVPQAAGKTFAGWYADAGLTEPWDFAQRTVKEKTTIYARWNQE